MLGKIDDLVVEMKTFGLVKLAEPPQVVYRQTHSALDDSAEIFGSGDDKEVVVKMLLDQQDELNVQVLPIVAVKGFASR